MLGLPLDVAGPGIFLAAGVGLGVGLAAFVVVVLVEAGVLSLMRWARFGRALLASLVMNVATTVVGLFVAALALSTGFGVWLLFTFAASVLLEAGVLALMDRPKARLGAVAALVANLITYIPLGALLFLLTRSA
jgi:hypothetical protein